MFKSKISVINFNKCKNIELIATVIFIMKIIEGAFLSYYNLRAMVENFGISIFKVINSFLEGSSTLNSRTSNPLIYYSETLSFSIEIVGILCFAFLKHFLKPKARKNNRFFLITVFVIFVLISSVAEILVYYSTPAGLILSIPRPFQIFGHIPLIGSLMLLNHFDSLLLRKRYLKIIRMLLLVVFSILIFLKSLGLFIRFVDQNIYYSYGDVLRREDLTIADFIAKHADYSIRIYGSGDVIGHIALLTNINYTSHLISYLPTVSGTSYINSLDALIILTEKSNRWIFYGVRQQIPANYINLTGILSFASGKVYDDGNNIAII
jgi:CRP-like cAMP-binding protein